jgi:hypothetical protein
MSKGKSTEKSVKAPEGKPAEAAATPSAGGGDAAPFTAKESMRLLRVNRFLVKIAEPSMARARAKVAYTTSDHQEGWRLYRVAAGEGQPLEAAAVEAPSSGAHVGMLQQLDDFENKWFPRTRRIIERFTPEGHRQGLLDAFFRDLQQQPIGPLVVGSVSTFLDRVEALEKSDVPGAAKVRSVLAARGVDAAHIARLRKTLDEARALKAAPAAAVTRPDGGAAGAARGVRRAVAVVEGLARDVPLGGGRSTAAGAGAGGHVAEQRVGGRRGR